MLQRQCEPELMDDPNEAIAYARADFAGVNQKFVGDLLAQTKGYEIRRVVDLGCGPADIAARLHRERPAWRITAVDGSMAMLRIGQEILSVEERVNLVLGHAQHLPLRDKTADVVISNSLLHHLPNPEPFWKELRRIARPGAYVMVRDLMRPDSDAIARAIVRQYAGNESALLREEFYRSLLAAFTPEEIQDQLDSAGLNELNIVLSSDRHIDVAGRV